MQSAAKYYAIYELTMRLFLSALTEERVHDDSAHLTLIFAAL